MISSVHKIIHNNRCILRGFRNVSHILFNLQYLLCQNVGRRLYAERFYRVQRCFKTKFVYLRVRENTRHIIENSREAKAEKSLIATRKTTQIPFIYRIIFCESFWVVEIDHISSLFSTLELLHTISHFGFGYQYWFRSLYDISNVLSKEATIYFEWDDTQNSDVSKTNSHPIILI